MKRFGVAIISAAALSAAPAHAGFILPGPVMGDSGPGIAVVLVLVAGYFLFRHLRKKKQS